MLENYIENSKDKIIEHTQKLIKIPSIHSKSNDPSKPFGENANKALEYILVVDLPDDKVNSIIDAVKTKIKLDKIDDSKVVSKLKGLFK